MQNCIDSLPAVARIYDLNFHTSKSRILYFGSTHDTSIHLIGSFLEQINDNKDLGIKISNTSNWSNHVDKQIAKCSKVFNFIRRSVPYQFSVSREKLLYQSLILCILVYCSPF